MANRIQLRRDTTANWNSIDPVLADGEMGYDIVTNEIRIGNGSNVWSELSGNTISGGGGTGTSLTNNGYTFSLETNGNLTLPNVGYINAPATVDYGNASNITITAGTTTGCSSVGGSVILNAGLGGSYGGDLSGNVQINTHYGSWRFGADGVLTLPSGGYINAPPNVDGYYGDASNVTINAGTTQGCSSVSGSVILNAANNVNLDPQYSGKIQLNTQGGSWLFGANGMTSFPEIDGTKTLWGAVDDDFYIKTTRTDPGNDADIEIIAADDLRLYAEGDQLELYANTSVEINADYNGSSKIWSFGQDGNLTLPAGGQIQSPSGTGNVTIETNDGNNTRSWTFETDGNITFPDATTQGTAYQRTTGSWTVTTGSDDYSFTVPLNGTYTMWVRGNIPNGIITWNATATVTNDNVPVLGQQFAWNYDAFNPMPLEITALPVQFIGTANTIINANVYGGGPSNTFTFTVNNASGSSRTVYWGYVAQ
jgi:hypothetical protein